MLAAGWTVALVVLRFLAARAPLLGIEVRPETRPTPRPPRRFDPPSTGLRLGRYHPSASAAGITRPAALPPTAPTPLPPSDRLNCRSACSACYAPC